MAMSTITIKELGKVREVKKIIAKITGLSNFMNGQLVNFASGIKGMIIGFQGEEVLALLLGDESKLRIGEEVLSLTEEFKIPVGEKFLGRIISPLAQPCDSPKPPIEAVGNYPVFREAPETMDRDFVDSCLETGIKIIDAIIPIAKGQRQLIIGDRMTGKTTIALDAILNQKGKNVICIYCCIGKSLSSLIKSLQVLQEKGALDYTTVVAATASTTVGEQFIAPYSACALGEYFMYQGKDVLVVFDDMTKHAWSYRQLSLLLERPPGREAYPGDIYYIHSQLLERAGKLNKQLGGGSMTFLPIVETLQADVTGFIPSNLISMTDGQIYLNSTLFAEGFKPAIDFSMSVSIIGNRVQNHLLKKLASFIRPQYLEYNELLRLTKLKTGLTPTVERTIHRGEALGEILAQDKNKPTTIEELIFLLYAFGRKVLDHLSIEQIRKFKNKIWEYVVENKPELVKQLQVAKDLSRDTKQELDKIIVGYFKEK